MAGGLVYGFLDESPSLASTAFFFCVDILIGDNPHKDSLIKIIKKAREKLGSKEQISELKFANTKDEVRKFVLTALSHEEVEIVVFIVKTEMKKVADTAENYGLVVGQTIAEAALIHNKLSIVLDKKYSKKTDIQKMEELIKRIVKSQVRLSSLILNEGDSKVNPILQLADFVAGALNYKYNHNDTTYFEIIKNMIVVEKLVDWKTLKRTVEPWGR
ncbi:MAG: DUF3800 domain-containing protein [bacterium]|nr:DUF3800 domain-containing protein [bacterium]